MDAVTEHGKRGVTEKVKDILPIHSALAPHVPASGVFSSPSCAPDYAVSPTILPWFCLYTDQEITKRSVWSCGHLSAQACFGHGHLYVAPTRRRNHQNVEVYVSDTQYQTAASVIWLNIYRKFSKRFMKQLKWKVSLCFMCCVWNFHS